MYFVFAKGSLSVVAFFRPCCLADGRKAKSGRYLRGTVSVHIVAERQNSKESFLRASGASPLKLQNVPRGTMSVHIVARAQRAFHFIFAVHIFSVVDLFFRRCSLVDCRQAKFEWNLLCGRAERAPGNLAKNAPGYYVRTHSSPGATGISFLPFAFFL